MKPDMTKNIYPETRREAILEKTNDVGQVTVQHLSQFFGVSEVTIRTDLQNLAEQGLVIRTHGGAVATTSIPELSLSLRRKKQIREKNEIGLAASLMVDDGEAIFLDISSTALALSSFLKEHKNLTVLTNSLPLAQSFIDSPGVTVVMPGGILQRDTLSLTGVEGMRWIQKYNIQKGFFGAHGLAIPEGLTDVSQYEAEVKQMMVKQCKQVIAIIDSTKWGRVGLASFAMPDEIDIVITDQKADAQIVSEAASIGIKIIQV